MSVAENAEQCRAITADGDRCSHAAREDGFCHQHDESDRTVDEQSSGDDTESGAGDGTDGSDGGSAADDAPADEVDGESGDATDGTPSDDPADDESGSDGGVGDEETLGDDGDEVGSIMEVRETVHAVAERLIGQELDGVVEITQNGDDWLATVEVVERRAVPNTQDILGKYEVVLDTAGTVTGYRRLDTYRRGDTSRGNIAP